MVAEVYDKGRRLDYEIYTVACRCRLNFYKRGDPLVLIFIRIANRTTVPQKPILVEITPLLREI